MYILYKYGDFVLFLSHDIPSYEKLTGWLPPQALASTSAPTHHETRVKPVDYMSRPTRLYKHVYSPTLVLDSLGGWGPGFKKKPRPLFWRVDVALAMEITLTHAVFTYVTNINQYKSDRTSWWTSTVYKNSNWNFRRSKSFLICFVILFGFPWLPFRPLGETSCDKDLRFSPKHGWHKVLK